MSSKIKELNEEDLEKVTGGLTEPSGECTYFLSAFGKEESGKCDDCFYYHEASGCSVPKK